MQLGVYLLLGLALAWVVYLVYVWIASQAVNGKDVSRVLDQLPPPAQTSGALLVYCYSPTCGPCRSMSPIIEELREHGMPVLKLDIADSPELGKELEVRAVPTLLLVENGVVSQTLVGAQSQARIEALLDS